MHQPTAEQALARLQPLVGTWKLTLTPPGPDAPRAESLATVEWDELGAFLLVRTVAQGYTQLYSDERGVCRVYEMSIDDREWTLRRDGDPFPQRFSARFTDDHSVISGAWEKAEDGETWATDFALVYEKVGEGRTA